MKKEMELIQQIQKAEADYTRAQEIAEAAFESSYAVYSRTHDDVRAELEAKIKDPNYRGRFNFVSASEMSPIAEKRLAENQEYQKLKAIWETEAEKASAAHEALESITLTPGKERIIDLNMVDQKNRGISIWVKTFEKYEIEDNRICTRFIVAMMVMRNNCGFGAAQAQNVFESDAAREKYIAKRTKQTLATYKKKFSK